MNFSQLTDLEIRDLLIAKHPKVTEWFFYHKCHRLFKSVINFMFSYKVNYNEYVNTVYAYLMEDDAKRLRSYDGTGSIYSWMKTTIFHLTYREQDTMIDDRTKETPYILENEGPKTDVDLLTAKIDFAHLLSLLKKDNERMAYVLERIILDGAEFEEVASELNVTVDNLYNIKKRALAKIEKYL